MLTRPAMNGGGQFRSVDCKVTDIAHQPYRQKPLRSVGAPQVDVPTTITWAVKARRIRFCLQY
jgi:hypothetical protein